MHAPKRSFVVVALALVLLIVAGGWYGYNRVVLAAAGSGLEASGTVEAVEVRVAPESGGRVHTVLVNKGDRVQAGDMLLRLDDELLQSQRTRAAAALESAQANLTLAQTGEQAAQAGLHMAEAALQSSEVSLESARLQHQLVLDQARTADQKRRQAAWGEDMPSEFTLPAWYFERSETLAAAETELEAARQALAVEQEDFAAVLKKVSNADVKAAEVRLAQAQSAYDVAEEVLDRAQDQNDEELEDYAQSIFDAAEAELEAAQSDYDRLLSKTSAQDLLDARARLAVAQERYAIAQDRIAGLRTGEQSLQLQVAALGVQQAEAALAQAQAGVEQAQASLAQAQARRTQAQAALTQAQAELNLVDVQLARLVVYAAVDGVVLSRSVEPGEVLQPAATAMTLGQLNDLTITVYLPEDRYGQVSLGDVAQVEVDSFPGQTFHAEVVYVAGEAEFTPRNVQTAEGRRTTVFAVQLQLEDTAGQLKPGMPADVKFK